MMKFRELTTGRKAIVVAANIVFFGTVILHLCNPSLPTVPVMGVEFACIGTEILASLKSTQRNAD